MMNAILAILAFFMAFSLSAERPPLTSAQLQKEADQICMGTVSDIQSERECFNLSCTDYRMDYTVKFNTTSCSKNYAPVVYARFFDNVYEGCPPPGASGHYPQPAVGQAGTMYLKDGEIVYPNGWVLEE